jgi:hypothetical protein
MKAFVIAGFFCVILCQHSIPPVCSKDVSGAESFGIVILT